MAPKLHLFLQAVTIRDKFMHEFNEGDLHSGKTETIVTNPKQAIAIALSEAEELEKKK